MTDPAEGWRRFVAEANAATGFQPGPIAETIAPTSFSLPSGPPSIDPIESLPPAAAEKLRLLRQRAADAHAIIPPFEDVRQASLARTDAANAVARLTAHPQDNGRNLPETDPLVAAAKRHLDKMTAEYTRLQSCRQCGRRSGKPHPPRWRTSRHG
jgi:hypothetical protein